MPEPNLLLDSLPEGWTNYKFDETCSCVSDSVQPNPDGSRPYLGLEHLSQGMPTLVGCGVESDVKSSKNAFQLGDSLFGKLRPYLRKAIRADFEGICSTDILVFRPKNGFDSLYLTFLLHNDAFVEHAKMTTSGVQHPRTSWPSLKKFKLSAPPLDEQKRIAYVLSTVQGAIAQQEQIIQTTTELKKALMHKLFTEGLHGEKQKETAIGLVPESWDVVRLDSVTDDFQYGTSVKCDYSIDGVPVLRIPNVVGGHVDTDDLKFGNPKTTEIEKLSLQLGDLLFVRTNGVKENAGRCSMYRGELGDSCYYASYLIRVRLLQEVLNPEFLEEYSRTEVGALFLSGQAIRTADGKFNINSGTLKRMLVPKPDVKEQREIANVASLLDSKIRLHKGKKSALSGLFQTLLHQLMTAQICVHDIDLPGFDDLANITSSRLYPGIKLTDIIHTQNPSQPP